MKESEAWREIARRIAEGEWSRNGLCYEVSLLVWAVVVPWETGNVMRRRVARHLWGKVWAYPRKRDTGPRILAALWLALEAESEETT